MSVRHANLPNLPGQSTVVCAMFALKNLIIIVYGSTTVSA